MEYVHKTLLFLGLDVYPCIEFRFVILHNMDLDVMIELPLDYIDPIIRVYEVDERTAHLIHYLLLITLLRPEYFFGMKPLCIALGVTFVALTAVGRSDSCKFPASLVQSIDFSEARAATIIVGSVFTEFSKLGASAGPIYTKFSRPELGEITDWLDPPSSRTLRRAVTMAS